jgi:hypothetical protein
LLSAAKQLTVINNIPDMQKAVTAVTAVTAD